MPIPNDLAKRWWVEAAGANPELVDSFRPTLVAFLAFDRDRIPQLTGTGFVVAAESEFALVISAKHVFTEGVLRAQRPTPGHAASALIIHRQDKIPSIEPDRLKVMWMGSANAAMLNAIHASYNDTLDIASCIVIPQEGESIPQRVSIPMDTDDPSVGEVVHMVAMEGMEVTELVAPQERNGKGQEMSFFRRVSIRVGVVTAVYPKGLRQYRWPCFTTSIPAKPGMSGGFVYSPREGTSIAACGVVCADNSTDDAHRDFFQCGESVIASAWPALSLRIPFAVPCQPSAPTRTLFEMIRLGHMPQPLGGIERIRVVETSNGDCVIGKGAFVPPSHT
jgi:hypothetical protein